MPQRAPSSRLSSRARQYYDQFSVRRGAFTTGCYPASPSTRASCRSANVEITSTTMAPSTFARRELRRGCQGKEGERPTGNLSGPGRIPPNSSILEGERAVVTVTDANMAVTTHRSLPVAGGDHHQARSPELLTPGDGSVGVTIMISIRATTPDAWPCCGRLRYRDDTSPSGSVIGVAVPRMAAATDIKVAARRPPRPALQNDDQPGQSRNRELLDPAEHSD